MKFETKAILLVSLILTLELFFYPIIFKKYIFYNSMACTGLVMFLLIRMKNKEYILDELNEGGHNGRLG